jgi:hypothetical protein
MMNTATVLDSGLSFIFTRKNEPHPWTAEQAKRGCAEELNVREWNGKYHLETGTSG